MATPTTKTKSATRRGGKKVGQTRIEIEIADLRAQCGGQQEEELWHRMGPSSDESDKVKSLWQVDTQPLMGSFINVAKPTEHHILVLLRSSGVLPLVYQFLNSCDVLGLERYLETHHQDIFKAGQGVIEVGKAVAASLDTAGHDACTVQCAQLAKALANKNQDIFFEIFHFGHDDLWDIMLVCAVVLLTAFDDMEKDDNGFFATLLESELKFPMPSNIREKWNKTFKWPSTLSIFIQTEKYILEGREEQVEIERLARSYEEVEHHKTIVLSPGSWSVEEKLTFFLAFRFQGHKKQGEDPCRRVADLMLRRNYWECCIFFRDNEAKLSTEVVKPLEEAPPPVQSGRVKKPTAAAPSKKRKLEEVRAKSVDEEAEARKELGRRERASIIAEKSVKAAALAEEAQHDAAPPQFSISELLEKNAALQKKVEGKEGFIMFSRYSHKKKIRELEAEIKRLNGKDQDDRGQEDDGA